MTGWIGITEAARGTGYSTSQAGRWEAEGAPCERRGRKVVFESAPLVQWLVSRARKEKTETASSERALLDAERRRAVKRENDVEERLLLRVEELEPLFRRLGQGVRNAHRGLAARLAPELAELDDAARIQTLLDRALEDVDRELAAQFGRNPTVRAVRGQGAEIQPRGATA